MQNALLPRSLTLGLLMFAAAACDENGGPCEPGQEVECSCGDGEEGTRFCLSNRRFDECYCGSDIDLTPRSSGRGSAGSAGSTVSDAAPSNPDPFFGLLDGGRDAGLDGGLDAGSIDGLLLASGGERLLDVFATEQNVWLVLPSRIERIELADGSVAATWSAPRPLTGAVYDGARLIALDLAKLTMLSPEDLEELGSSNLIEPCYNAALSAGSSLLCTSSADGYALHGIEPTDGGRVDTVRTSRSGGKLISVPGTSRFLSADGTGNNLYPPLVIETAADAGLALVGDAGALISVSSGFALPFGFDSVPPQNLVTRTGILHRISASCGTTDDPCLARTGTLGLLGPQEVFLGMSTAQSDLFGLVDPNSSTMFTQARCDLQPCRLQRIDVAERVVRAERRIRRPLRNLITMHVLRDAGALVMAFTAVGNDRYYSSFTDAGYEVVRLDLPEDQ